MKGAVRKGIATLLIVLVIFLVGGRTLIDPLLGYLLKPMEIKDGFREEWLETLKTEYSLSIPESAVYLKGYEEPGQDFSVHMLFTVDAVDFDGMLGKGWTKDVEGHTFGEEWYDDLTDEKMPYYYIYSKQYTVLFYSEADKNGTVTCVFVGWRPKSQ